MPASLARVLWRVGLVSRRSTESNRIPASPQMDPLGVDLHTIRALEALSTFDGRYRFDMRARCIRHCRPFIRGELDVRRRPQ